MTDVKGIKMPRGKKGVIESYNVTVPQLDTQRELAENIDTHKAEINRAKEVVEGEAARRQMILEKYLKREISLPMR